MSNLGAAACLLLATAASLAAHLLAYSFFVVQTCGVSDVADRYPANASYQGWTCGAYADGVAQVPGVWVLGFSTVLAVTAAAWLWSRGGAWPWVSPLGLVVAPVLAVVALSLPPDDCTSGQRAAHGATECRTTPDT